MSHLMFTMESPPERSKTLLPMAVFRPFSLVLFWKCHVWFLNVSPTLIVGFPDAIKKIICMFILGFLEYHLSLSCSKFAYILTFILVLVLLVYLYLIILHENAFNCAHMEVSCRFRGDSQVVLFSNVLRVPKLFRCVDFYSYGVHAITLVDTMFVQEG